jgi:hypothetical protein
VIKYITNGIWQQWGQMLFVYFLCFCKKQGRVPGSTLSWTVELRCRRWTAPLPTSPEMVLAVQDTATGLERWWGFCQWNALLRSCISAQYNRARNCFLKFFSCEQMKRAHSSMHAWQYQISNKFHMLRQAKFLRNFICQEGDYRLLTLQKYLDQIFC